MELTQRELITAIHGMLFGGFFLMAVFGAFVLLLELSHSDHCDAQPPARPWQTAYLVLVAVLGWAAVLTGRTSSIPGTGPSLPLERT